MYLIDSNVFLELLLDQSKADEAAQFLQSMPDERLHISEFSLYSIGIVLFHRKIYDTFVQFLNDLLRNGGINLLRLSIHDMEDITNVAQRFNLDFDDAYQYVVAEKNALTIISFDKDFDRTEKGRKTPAEVLK